MLVSIAMVHIILMAVFVFDMVRREKLFLKKQNREQVLGMVSNIAVNAEQYLIKNDYDGLERLVQSHRHSPFLKYAMVVSNSGLILAHTDTARLGFNLKDSVSRQMKSMIAPRLLIETDEILDMAAPVFSGGAIIGWSRVGVGQEYIHENLVSISRNGLLYILLAMMVGSVCAIIISGRLSSGLYKLIAAANKIKTGDKNFRTAGFNSYELTQLSNAFNQMLDEITSSYQMTNMILENLPVAIWILDKDGTILSVNTEGKRIWGGAKMVSLDQYNEYKAWLPSGKKLAPEDWAGVKAVLNGETTLNQELEIECFDGSRKMILNSGIPLLDKQGLIIRGIVINVDITEKRKAEQDLVKVNYAIGERIKELNCLYRISEIAGHSEIPMKELLQRSVELIPPSYQYPQITAARIVFEKEVYVTPGFEASQWRQAAYINFGKVSKGMVEVFYTKEMPEYDEGPFLKEERFMIDSIADILGNTAEKKERETELRVSEEKFRGLVEQNLVGFFILQENYFRYINPGFEQLSGYSKTEIENRIPFEELVFEYDREKVKENYLNRLNDETVETNYSFRIYHKHGSVRTVEAFLSRIIFEDKPAVLGSLVDITERIEDEKRISRAVTDAQEKERTQIGMELHDNVQQILVGALISIDFTKRKQDNKALVESTLTNIGTYIHEALQELRRLSHQLTPSAQGAGSFRDKLLRMISTMKKMENVKFIVEVDDNGLQLGEDVQVSLYRIVQEQLSNIYKYAKAGIVEIDLKQEGHFLCLSVVDNGKGFDMLKAKTGIGFGNIQRRTKLLGGVMKIWSEPGKGCRLVVGIPI